MDSQEIRALLGALQEDPDPQDRWAALAAALKLTEGDLPRADALRLLGRARRAHAARGEAEAVAAMLALEVEIAKDTPDELALVVEQVRVQSEELFDDEGALVATLRILEISPDDAAAAQALTDREDRRARFRELAATYLAEAEGAPDDVYRSSMLMRAAEMELRFGGEAADRAALAERLERAVALDPDNERAVAMLERLYRRMDRHAELARLLLSAGARPAGDPRSRAAALVRAGRVLARRLGDAEGAARAFERALEVQADHPDAVAFLDEHYSHAGNWDALVALYERQIPEAEQGRAERLGDMLQVAMLHWRKRGDARAADAWFERVRRLDPGNQGMLTFFREHCVATQDQGRLVGILQAAQKVLPDGPERQEVTQQLASLAEQQKDAQKAIEQYKSLLRQDPDDQESRARLKELYRRTQGHNALVELLRQELERVDPADAAKRLELLREVAGLYRTAIKSDTALVSALNQIVQLDERDVETVRELVALYDRLGRARDLLAAQQKLADVSSDPAERVDLYRGIARRWLEQFSNVQNATTAFEALLSVSPGDPEACQNLAELYKKRRAWPQLFELYQGQVATLAGPPRLALLTEMAQLAAERLGRGEDAARLYREVLADDPGNLPVLDALERAAERAKDWATLAEALERRVDVVTDDAARLAVLQKLGTVYAEHLADHAGAVRAWQRVLDLQPGHQRALRVLRDSYLLAGDYDGLTELYARQDDWEGLAEVLGNTADRAKESAARVELSYRAAAVYRDRLGQPQRAFRAFERILATDPTDVRAASELIPLYEADEKWARLPALYELLVERTEDPSKRAGYLGRLAEIAGARLSDRAAAAGYARRAFECQPDRAELLEALEQATRAAGTWPALVEVLEARVKATEGATRRELSLRLAEILDREAARPDDAVAILRGLVGVDGGDVEAGAALEAILRRDGRKDDLRWLLGLRVEGAAGDADRAAQLADWATLEETVFGDPARAADLHRKILGLLPGDPTSLHALPRLLVGAGDAAGAAAVLEEHREAAEGGTRIDAELALAELQAGPLAAPERALAGVERVLELAPHEPRAVALAQRLLAHDRTRDRAAQILSAEYEASGDGAREAEALRALLDARTEPSERRELLGRLATVHEEKLGAPGAALDVVLRALAEFPAVLELWGRANDLAARAQRPADLAEAYRVALSTPLPEAVELELAVDAARLHEERLGDPVGAAPYLERVLARNPGDDRAFTRLKQILTGAERWAELEALYDRAALATDDPSTRAEMLAEVAMVCEEIMEAPAKATRYYERILEVDPNHDSALGALDRLYGQSERHADLAALLERRIGSAVAEAAVDMKLRLARLCLERLADPERAIRHVEDVLVERPNDFDARQLAEKLLESPPHRVRATRILESVYDGREEWRDLARVLELRLTALDEAAGPEAPVDDERRELLRRTAALRDEKLRDDAGALAALSRFVPLDPLDEDARTRLLGIGRRVGQQAKVAEVLERASERADTSGMRAEILSIVARLYEEELAQPALAEATYRKVLALDPDDAALALPAARALQKLALAASDNQKLREALEIQVRLESGTDARCELLARLGHLDEDVLGDLDGATTAWTLCLEERPGDPEALAALDRIHERGARWRELVRVLEQRRDRAEDPAARRGFMQRIAALHAERLGEATDAVEAYRAILDEFGPAPDALEPLERLYLAAGRHAELADALEAHLDLADAADVRLGLLARLGDLRVTHLGNASGAISAYRDALSLDATHEPSRTALERLLGAEDPAVRRDAAEILHPIYEADGDNARLLRVLEVEIATADDPEARLAGLEKAVSVAAGPLADPVLALSFAARAVREAAAAGELRPWLAELERLAAVTSRRAEQVELLREIAAGIFDGDVQFEVTVRVAELARDALSDRTLAREWFEKALELRADDAATLLALEALYEGLGDVPALLRVLEQRTELSADDGDRKALLYRRARLLAEPLGEKARAAEVYESILDLGLERDALDALEALYSEQERWSDLVALHQREMDAPGAAATDLHVKIARIADRRLHDLDRAFDELEAALEADRNHAGALAELEHLLGAAPEVAARARAATLLEPVYLVRGEYDRVMATLRARLEACEEPSERRELLVRLAQLHEEQKEDYASALETMALVLREDIEDTGTVAELERLAKVGAAERRLAEIYAAELERVPGDDAGTARLAARAGELFAGLGETERALALTRRALAFEPESVPLFVAVDALLQKKGDAEGRVALHREALEHRFEPADRQALLHVIADLERGTLGRAEDAIQTLRQIVEGDERDGRALDALAELYSAGSRHRDLAELLLRRAEGAVDPAESARFRFELAKLHAGPLGEVGAAVDQLEEIVRVAPHHQEAVAMLEALKAHDEHRERIVEILRPLYEGADDWRRLIKLNEDRFGIARDDSEKVRVLRETAQLWESRGADPGRARRALGLAVELDPEDGEVRGEYERLVAATSAWDELTEIYEAVLAAQPDLPSERELIRRVAEVHDRHRDDPRRALVAYERLHALDPSDMEPLDKLEALATLLSDWAALDRVLVAKAGLVVSDEDRASLWRRVAEGRRDMLEDAAGAVAAYDQALELEPDSAFTIDRLLELLEERGAPARLVELYRRRVELTPADDTDLRYQLLMDSARRLETDLVDRSGAIEALGQALSARPGDREVLSALNRLYRAEGLWADLLDNLRLEAASADTIETRAALRREIGDILATRQSAYEEALDAYGLVLAESPGDAQVTQSVRRLAEEHEHLRAQAAGILVPVLTQQGSHDALVEVLELRLSTESEPQLRASTLRVIAEILEQRLARPAEAEGALLRAMAEVPEAADLHAEIERVAAVSAGFGRYADALAERAKATFDSSLARDLFARLGRVAQARLGDDRRAVAAYLSAIEQVGDQPELLEALDVLYARLGDSTALADVLERRVGLSAPGRDQAELHYRLAIVFNLEFKEPARGLASLRAALEQDPTHEGALEELEALTDIADLFEEAAEVLERVYRAQARTDRLAGLFEKRVKQAGTVGERLDLRRSLARVLEDEGRDAGAALRVLELGLADDPTDAALLEEVERLAAVTGGWESAGKALREAVEKKVDLVPDVARDLLVRAAVWFRDRGGLPRLAEETLTKALDFDASNDEVLVQIEQLQSGGGRERDLVATLRRRAKIVDDDETRLGLFRRARDLAVALDDRELAEAVLRELIGHDDSNAWALAELSGLRELAKDHKEVVRLLLRRAELSVDPVERRELRHRAARATRDELSDGAGATALFAALFAEDPADEEAGVALRALYEAAGKHTELAALLEKLCEVATSPASRGDLRLSLARLRADKFADAGAAVALLRSILEEEPGRADAVVELTSLFEREKRHADLAALLEEQIAGATARGDTEGALTFRLRLASVRERALGDKAGAARVYEEVLSSDAEHRPALEALARLYPALGDEASAARILGRLLGLASTAEEGVPLALSLASVAEKLGDAEGAIAALERGLGFDAASARVRDPLRAAYERAAAWEKLAGLVAGDADLASQPDDQVKALRAASSIHRVRRGDAAAAAALLERASALRADDRELLLELCDAYSACGRAKAAVEALERIVASFGGKRSKELAEIHRRLAVAYRADSDLTRAIEELDKAFRMEPGNVHVLRELGLAALEAGDLKKAQQMFRALLLQKLDDAGPISKAEVFLRLGEVHLRLGEKPKAVQNLERALQTDPSLEQAKALLAEAKS